MANYSLPEIANFLTSEKVALHGTSPEAYAQNAAIVERLGSIAATVGEGVLAVQLFGSRANGYSDLKSDIDINVVAVDEPTRKNACALIIDQMTEFVPDLETENVACITAHIDNPVPNRRSAFTEWVMTDWGPHSIFGDGLIPSDNLLLTRLAALEVINAHTNPRERQDMHDRIRAGHAKTFLGALPRMQRKLAARLGEPIGDVEAITSVAYQKRQEVFGLPQQFTTHRAQLAAWATQNSDNLKCLPAYDLYRSLV